MKYVLCCAVVFLATLTSAQQQGQSPPATNPPYQTPPTFPEGRQRPPTAQMPPDTQATPPQTMSSEQAERKIMHRLSSEPTLANTNVDAKVDDNSVELSGMVDSETQHDLALRIARSYSGDRKVVDKIKVRKQT
jgi:hypothetical protein